MEENLYVKQIFIHPFTCIIAGPSGCGKTCFMMKIVKNVSDFIKDSPNRIIYCYSEWQDGYDCIKDHVEFIHGILDLNEINKEERNLIILDDLMDESQSNQNILDLFTKGSHHRNISVILMAQNIFNKAKHSRTINLNTQYTILFKNPRDRTQINHLARQMFPENSKFLINSYNDATKNAHGYLFIDNKQETDDKIRVQTNITDEIRLVYSKK